MIASTTPTVRVGYEYTLAGITTPDRSEDSSNVRPALALFVPTDASPTRDSDAELDALLSNPQFMANMNEADDDIRRGRTLKTEDL